MSTVYVIMGRAGEYSDRSEWPIRARRTEQQAQEDVSHLSDLSREMMIRASAHHDEIGEAFSAPDYEWDADFGTVITPTLQQLKQLDNGGDKEMLRKVLYHGYGGVRYFYYTVDLVE